MNVIFSKRVVLFLIFIWVQRIAISQTSNCISEVKASGWQIFEQHNVGIGAITTAVYFGENNSLPALSYQWYVNKQDKNENGDLISGATESKFVPSSAVIGEFYYYCVVSGGVGACGLNTNVSNTIKIIVKPISTPSKSKSY